MSKKKVLIGGIVIVLVVAILVAGAQMFGLFETLPKPEIKEGEFDFTLTYEIDGEIKTINGTYVCKFDKIQRELDGIARHWDGYIKDHDDFTAYELKTTEDGVIKVELDICSEFFMSDPAYKLTENTDVYKPEPYLYITSGDPTIEDPTNVVSFDYYEGDDVKIISFEYDAPIENIYK